MNQRRGFQLISQRTAFVLVFLLITLVLVGSSLGLVAWIWNQLQAIATPPPPPNTAFVDYNPGGNYLRGESLQAMAAYIQQYPEPQNVQILTGMSTAQISTYMTNHVSGGLKVDCTFCHVLTNGNFAEEGNPNKNLSRNMMRMTADLNQNWVAQLPASVGGQQVTCATCHNGKNRFETYPDEAINTLPADFELPLNLQYPGGLAVTGQITKSLEDVALNQYTMYHMNVSLGVGCTHCHNARYFPSNEIESKGHAQIMLQMVQHTDRTYKQIMNNKAPSCYSCHQGNNIPPGAATSAEAVPAVLSTDPPPGTELGPISGCDACHPDNAQLSMSNE